MHSTAISDSAPTRTFFERLLAVCALSLIIFCVLVVPVIAHTEEALISSDPEVLRSMAVSVVYGAALILIVLTIVALLIEEPSPSMKEGLFVCMAVIIVLPTLYFIGTTIYINIISVTGGPVHWHADFKINVCGEDFLPPTPPHVLSNKTGTAVLHEHVDRRIHVEGVVVNYEDVTLASFFGVQGGKLEKGSFTIPTEDKVVLVEDGDTCPNGSHGVWNVFAYRTEDGVARQERLDDYPSYVLSPYGTVPPGDCIIFEFGPAKARTEAFCDFYQIEVGKGNLTIE